MLFGNEYANASQYIRRNSLNRYHGLEEGGHDLGVSEKHLLISALVSTS